MGTFHQFPTFLPRALHFIIKDHSILRPLRSQIILVRDTVHPAGMTPLDASIDALCTTVVAVLGPLNGLPSAIFQGP